MKGQIATIPDGVSTLSHHGSRLSAIELYGTIQPQINEEGIHVWPFDPILPVDLHFLRHDGQRTVRNNRHQYFEAFVVCEGEAILEIEDRILQMNKGDLAIIGSSFYHTATCPPSSIAIICSLFFDPNLIRTDGFAQSPALLGPFLMQGSDFPHVVPAETGVPSQVFDLMRRIEAEKPAYSNRQRLAIKTHLRMILLLLVNHYSSYASSVETLQRRQCAHTRLRSFFEFVDGNIGEALQVEDAAHLCSLSEADFAYYFRQVTHQSFKGYLQSLRIRRAQSLLADKKRPISGIAQELGFCDQSYFGAVFRNLVGVTPAEYRSRQLSKADTPAGRSGPSTGCRR